MFNEETQSWVIPENLADLQDTEPDVYESHELDELFGDIVESNNESGDISDYIKGDIYMDIRGDIYMDIQLASSHVPAPPPSEVVVPYDTVVYDLQDIYYGID